MNPKSVRPIWDVDEEEFQRMMAPFDPTREEVEQWMNNQAGDSNNDQREWTNNPAGNSGDDHREDESEEAVAPRTRVAPIQPTPEEVDRHMVTHLPFREWCPHCVRGKSVSKPHRPSEGAHDMPTLALDYMFMHSNQSEGEENGMPILVTKDLTNCDRGTGMISASVVPSKGACPQAIKD